MLIEIIDVSAPTPVKKYFTIEVAYKANGKVQARKLMSFAYPQVFKDIQEFKRGDFVEVTAVKEGEYWQWTAVVKAKQEAQAAEAPREFKKEVAATRSNYETPEERAARQVLIVRQSSLSAALGYLELVKNTKATSNDVKRLADEFVDWVFTKENVKDEVPDFDIESDII